MDDSINPRISTRVTKLQSGMRISEAMNALSEEPETYGVVFNDDDTPVAVVLHDDLQRASRVGASLLMDPSEDLPPMVFIKRSKLEQQSHSHRHVKDITSLLDAATRQGARVGLIIGRSGDLNGIVELGGLRETLLSGSDFGPIPANSVLGGSSGGASPWDDFMGGGIATESLVVTMVNCAKPGCGMTNLVRRCSRGLLCVNRTLAPQRHVLQVNRECKYPNCSYSNIVPYCDAATCRNPDPSLPRHDVV